MRGLLPIAIVLLLPVSTLAETVAVLPISYTVYKTASAPKERSEKLKEAVFNAIERVDMTPLDLEEAQDGGKAFKDCADAHCTDAAARQADADIGIVVSVVDKDGQFEIVIHLSTHSTPVSASPFCSFNSMLQRVSGFVESALKEARQKREAAKPAPAPEDAQESSTVTDAEPDTQLTAPPLETASDRKKPLSPLPFYITAGVTVGLGIGYAAVESVGYSKLEKVEDKNDLDTLQLTSQILLGCTVATGIAAMILVFFTDFKSKSRKKRDAASKSPSIHMAPLATPDSLGLSMSGRF